MGGSAVFVVFFAALTSYSTDAAPLQWNSEVTLTGGKATLTRTIAEGVDTFNPPLTLTATEETVGGTLAYAIEPKQDPFAINDKGEITISVALDYETKSSYELEVKATETGDTPGTVTATVTITVTDVVSFSKLKDTVCVQEGAKADTDVITLPVPNTKETENDKYTLKPGNDAAKFELVDDKIKVKTTLDEKTSTPYSLTITADGKPDELELKVKVGDCSAAALLAPLGLLTLLMALVVSMN